MPGVVPAVAVVVVGRGRVDRGEQVARVGAPRAGREPGQFRPYLRRHRGAVAGSTGKRRVHIFWQRRIVADDVTTPYWYPFQTNSGAIRQDRLVFPIPPGVHWKDVRAESIAVQPPEKQLTDACGEKPRRAAKPKPAPLKEGGHLKVTPPGKVAILVGRKIKYVDRPGYVAPQPEKPAKAERPKREKAPPAKLDPKYLKAARELRDRYLEHVNASAGLVSCGKYEVARVLGVAKPEKPLALLPAA